MKHHGTTTTGSPNGSPYTTELTDDELVALLRDNLRSLEASGLVGPETAARLREVLDSGIGQR